MGRRLAGMVGMGVVVLWWTGIGMAREGVVPAEIAHKAQTEGVARVIVQLDVPVQPEGTLDSPQAMLAQRQSIAAAQTDLLAELAGTVGWAWSQTVPLCAPRSRPTHQDGVQSGRRTVPQWHRWS